MSVPAPRRFGVPAALAGVLALALLVLIAVAFTAARSARAQVDVTIDPVMTKGPASAPVTIIEFSDYQ